MHVIGQDDNRINIERQFNHGLPDREAQNINLLDEKLALAIGKCRREEIGRARRPGTSIVWHRQVQRTTPHGG